LPAAEASGLVKTYTEIFEDFAAQNPKFVKPRIVFARKDKPLTRRGY
jgi:hypothetical protein